MDAVGVQARRCELAGVARTDCAAFATGYFVFEITGGPDPLNNLRLQDWSISTGSDLGGQIPGFSYTSLNTWAICHQCAIGIGGGNQSTLLSGVMSLADGPWTLEPDGSYSSTGTRVFGIFFAVNLSLPSTPVGFWSESLLDQHAPPGSSGYIFKRYFESGALAARLYDPTVALLDSASLAAGPSAPACSTLDAITAKVAGAATDGVSQVVLRINGLSKDEQFSIGLVNGAGSETGWIGLPGATPTQSVVTARATCPDVSGGWVAYATYRAPIDFAWSTAQQSLAFRTIQIDAKSPQSNKVSVDVTVLRPPLVMVHGFNTDDPNTWQDFSPFDGDGTPIRRVFHANYGNYLLDEGLSVDRLDGNPGSFDKVRRSHLSFVDNWNIVAQQSSDFIDQFAQGSNPASARVVATQADFVAHSMGGLVLRFWALQPAYRQHAEGHGYIHKLVTIGTPHLGTPQATLSLESEASCSRGLAAYFSRTYSFSTADLVTTTGHTYPGRPGAAKAMEGDGTGAFLSVPLQLIRNDYGGVPIATVGGDITPVEFNIDYQFGASAFIRLACVTLNPLHSDPVARRFYSGLFRTTFDPTIRPGFDGTGQASRSDGSVPLTSALMNSSVSTCIAPHCFAGMAHSSGIAMFFFPTNISLLDSVGASARVQELLESPVTDLSTWSVR
ncbi:MAG: hypothetical protein R2745_10785 [Vicinamibacterales bacterium]